MPTRLIIFDSDGVLVDSEPIASRVLAEALTEIGFATSSRDAIQRYTGISLASILKQIETQWGRPLPADFANTLTERDLAAFRAELQPMPGVTETLRVLDQRGLAKCVASSGMPAKLAVTLGVTGLLPSFAPHVFSAAMVARGKPAPDLFLFAAAKMGMRAEDCVVVEDSIAGIEAAQAAGMRPFAFIGGGHILPDHEARLRDAGAAEVFARMTELPELLGKSS